MRLGFSIAFDFLALVNGVVIMSGRLRCGLDMDSRCTLVLRHAQA